MTHAHDPQHPPEPSHQAPRDASWVDGRRLYPIPAGELADQSAALVTRARAWLPPIDPVVFDCYLGELANESDPYTEGDPVGVLACLLAAAGVYLGPGAHHPIGLDRHPLVVWPLLIGPTSEGRKGTAYGIARGLLAAAAPDFADNNVHSGLSSGEGLASVFAGQTDQSPPEEPTLDPADDTASEDGSAGRNRAGAGKRGKRVLPDGDCRLLAYEPEWATVMGRMRREGNTLSPMLRAAWEGGNLSTLNVDARVARRAHVGIVACISPSEFKAKVSTSDMAGGTYNRFLPIAVAWSKLLPTPPDPAPLVHHHGPAFGARLHRAAQCRAVTLNGQARELWNGLYLEFVTPPDTTAAPELLAEFTTRAASQCLRIAALYAALDGAHLIQPGHLHAAAALVRYSIASAAAVLAPARSALADLAAFITGAGEQGRTQTDITKGFYKGKPPTDMATMLTRLVDTGEVTMTERPRPDGRGGRKTTIYTTTGTAKLANFRT